MSEKVTDLSKVATTEEELIAASREFFETTSFDCDPAGPLEDTQQAEDELDD